VAVPSEKTLVLFSGGVDSTYTAARLAASDPAPLLLVTWRVPAMAGVHLSQRTARQLQGRFPGRIEHQIRDIRGYVRWLRGGVLDCAADNARYGFHYSWCLGCKTAMHLQTIRLCEQMGITRVIDGSNLYDTHALEQRPDVLGFFEDLYRQAGVTHQSPFYQEAGRVLAEGGVKLALLRALTLFKDATACRVAWLASQGIDLGRGVGSQYRQTQPSCTISPFFNLARIGLNLLRPESDRGIHAYLLDKTRRAREASGPAASDQDPGSSGPPSPAPARDPEPGRKITEAPARGMQEGK